MLANLVRMRYFQTPVFLQVSSLNASFSVGANASLSGTFGSGGSNSGGAGLGGSYTESPTISFSMPESQEYFRAAVGAAQRETGHIPRVGRVRQRTRFSNIRPRDQWA